MDFVVAHDNWWFTHNIMMSQWSHAQWTWWHKHSLNRLRSGYDWLLWLGYAWDMVEKEDNLYNKVHGFNRIIIKEQQIRKTTINSLFNVTVKYKTLAWNILEQNYVDSEKSCLLFYKLHSITQSLHYKHLSCVDGMSHLFIMYMYGV